MKIQRKEFGEGHYYWVDGEHYPRVTKILEVAAPVPLALRQYLLRSTPETAEKKLQETGDLGSLVHQAIERLLHGEELNLKEEFPSSVVKNHLLAFSRWFENFRPEIETIQTEQVVASRRYRYAGTLDLACRQGGDLWIIDFKTTAGIYFSHELQIVAYKQAYEETTGWRVDKMGILRTGTRHRSGYEFKVVERPFSHFKAVYDTFLALYDGEVPKPPTSRRYPTKLRIIGEQQEEEKKRKHKAFIL